MYASRCSPLNLLVHVFSCYHWFLTAFPLRSPLTICCCNILEACVLQHTVLCVLIYRKYWLCDSERSFGSCCQRWMLGFCEDGCPVAADHKHRSSHCTQTTVSSYHSQRPWGLECACEWGAYFVFLSPDSHPWGSFHREMCSLLFSAPLYVRAVEPSRSTRLENLRVASNKSKVPQAFPPTYYRAPTDQPTQHLANK